MAQDLCEEISGRLAAARQEMERGGLSALLIYGNTRFAGSLTYLSGYTPDRTGWVSLGPDRSSIHMFDGAYLVVPAEGDSALVVDFGQIMDQEPCTGRIVGAGLSATGGTSLAGVLAGLLSETELSRPVGIETWDKFPAPTYLELRELLPHATLTPSLVVEELRLIKSPYEIDILRQVGRIADEGNRRFAEELRRGVGRSELDLIRVAEHAMRVLNPIYQDSTVGSPSKICSGTAYGTSLLHVPLVDKLIQPGDAVNWDISMRYCGYNIDTSRTRVVGKPTADQERAHTAATEAALEVTRHARPGVSSLELVGVAQRVIRDYGFELWENFLGHGIGLDVHERPDMGVEDLVLREHMVFTNEPRVALHGNQLLGGEDMVLVTADGAESLTHYPRTPLELDVEWPGTG